MENRAFLNISFSLTLWLVFVKINYKHLYVVEMKSKNAQIFLKNWILALVWNLLSFNRWTHSVQSSLKCQLTDSSIKCDLVLLLEVVSSNPLVTTFQCNTIIISNLFLFLPIFLLFLLFILHFFLFLLKIFICDLPSLFVLFWSVTNEPLWHLYAVWTVVRMIFGGCHICCWLFFCLVFSLFCLLDTGVVWYSPVYLISLHELVNHLSYKPAQCAV